VGVARLPHLFGQRGGGEGKKKKTKKGLS